MGGLKANKDSCAGVRFYQGRTDSPCIIPPMVRMRTTMLALLVWFSLAWAAVCHAPVASQVAPLPERYRYVFVVDASASMMGKGDGKAVIFPKVQQELLRFLQRLPDGSEVIIIPFHQGPQGEARFRLPEEHTRAEAYIRRLQANGSNTWIYRTLVQVLERLPKDEGWATVLYLFTDGIDNDRAGPYRMRDVVERLKLRRGPYDWLYYVALGVDVPEEVRRNLQGLPRVRIQEARVGEVPRLGAYTVKPLVLSLGNLKQEPAVEVPILVEAQGNPGPLGLRLEDMALQEKGAFLQVEPKTLAPGNQALRFKLNTSGSLSDGVYTAWLCLEAPEGTVVRPEALRVEFAYHPPALYRLLPEEVPQEVALPRGASQTLVYRLEGNAWAKEPLRLAVTSPEGLVAKLNGKKGPLEAYPGERVTLELTNVGLRPGQRVAFTLQAQAPAGAQLELPPTLPPVTQPLSWWDRVLRLWWLWLPLLLFVLWLLLKWWDRLRPWGEATFIGPAPECKRQSLSLRGVVDLGKATGERELEGVRLARRGRVVVLEGLPPGLRAKSQGMRLERGETLRKGEELVLENPELEKAWTLQIEKVR